jgi:hypothetical protein
MYAATRCGRVSTKPFFHSGDTESRRKAGLNTEDKKVTEEPGYRRSFFALKLDGRLSSFGPSLTFVFNPLLLFSVSPWQERVLFRAMLDVILRFP